MVCKIYPEDMAKEIRTALSHTGVFNSVNLKIAEIWYHTNSIYVSIPNHTYVVSVKGTDGISNFWDIKEVKEIPFVEWEQAMQHLKTRWWNS